MRRLFYVFNFTPFPRYFTIWVYYPYYDPQRTTSVSPFCSIISM